MDRRRGEPGRGSRSRLAQPEMERELPEWVKLHQTMRRRERRSADATLAKHDEILHGNKAIASVRMSHRNVPRRFEGRQKQGRAAAPAPRDGAAADGGWLRETPTGTAAAPLSADDEHKEAFARTQSGIDLVHSPEERQGAAAGSALSAARYAPLPRRPRAPHSLPAATLPPRYGAGAAIVPL